MHLGRLGEDLGCRFLENHGLVIVARNVAMGRGEIDVVCRDGSTALLVEIRTSTSTLYPLDAVGTTKRNQLVKLAATAGLRRIDLLGVGINYSEVIFHWAPEAA